MTVDSYYKALLLKAIGYAPRQTRNAKVQSYFGAKLTLDSLEHRIFPILLGRKMFYKGVFGELAAFLRGPKTIADFEAQGCNYWKPWADEDGSIEVDYGNAWLDYNGVNQLEQVVHSLKTDPYGRRHIIDTWRPDRLAKLSLPCCHYAYQWYVTADGDLEMSWTQRSVDLMVGLPSDIILCAAWNVLMAQTVGLKPGRLHFMLGDCHVYDCHRKGMSKYMEQSYGVQELIQPSWSLAKKATVFNFTPDMLTINNYYPKAPILLEVVA